MDILEWTKKGKDHHFIKKASTDSIQHQHLVFCKTIRSETELAQSHLLFTLLALHTLLTCQLILPYGFSAMVTWLLECIDVLKRQKRTNKQTKRNDFMFFFGTAFNQKMVILNLLFWLLYWPQCKKVDWRLMVTTGNKPRP